ncbi:hypothetical protein B9G54_01565 [Alloscardovia macacae]|uniref:Major structural phage protein n=1 Tax=Alloscardovia macacae TaxID=1160091 RepID=A0A1Y2T218_9BIFI|nr:hypothetical protein [Alloscardovia macacae]OTA27234.1 hypothetical protein B9G54_01565 [Alloscardovia macacae]OTA29244.1 hypothetical protein B9T39_03760 [Alloscardovia macacae]
MAITLAESAKLSTDALTQGVLETFVQSSPVLDRIPFIEIQGNSYAYNMEATLPGVAFRDVNEAYTESTGVVNQKSERLYILGGDADVDRFIEQTRSNLNDQRAVQTTLKVKALSYAFQDAFFNGDTSVNAKGFDGLKKRLTGKQVLDAGTNGLPVLGSSNTDIHKFLDKLDELLASVDGIDETNGAIYANSAILSKIRSAGRHISADLLIGEDITGKRVTMWNGIPILDAGNKPDGNAILPVNETQGTAQNTSSLYAVRYGQGEGETGVAGLTNGGVQVDDLGLLQDKPVYRTRVELYAGLAVFGGKAAARLKGVVNG